VYTEPVYYALAGQGSGQVAVTSPAHAKALKGHKTDAKDSLRLAEVRVRAAARQLHPGAGSQDPAGPDPVPDQGPCRARTSEIQHWPRRWNGGDQARLGGAGPDRQVRDGGQLG
jgi:hypothetical protein